MRNRLADYFVDDSLPPVRLLVAIGFGTGLGFTSAAILVGGCCWFVLDMVRMVFG
jgi:hypothetical protein